jgi:hypothetical protein
MSFFRSVGVLGSLIFKFQGGATASTGVFMALISFLFCLSLSTTEYQSREQLIIWDRVKRKVLGRLEKDRERFCDAMTSSNTILFNRWNRKSTSTTRSLAVRMLYVRQMVPIVSSALVLHLPYFQFFKRKRRLTRLHHLEL